MIIYGGIDIGGTSIKIGFVDKGGTILCKGLMPVGKITSYSDFIEQLSNKTNNLLETLNNKDAVVGFGVGCPGRIDVAMGKVIWLRGKLEYMENQDIGPDLASVFGKPVICDNDVNAMVLGETYFGKAKGNRNVIGLTFGTGIGGAIIINGQVLRGRHFAAGHFGFMSHDPNGKSHVCGNAGAAEVHASHSGIVDKVNKALRSGTETSVTKNYDPYDFGFKNIYMAAQQDDDFAKSVVTKLEEEITVLITNLIFAFDPDTILIGGGLLKADNEIVARITNNIKKRINLIPEKEIKLDKMSSYEEAGILGGAALAITELS